MRIFSTLILLSIIVSPAQARDFAKTFADEPRAVWNTSNHSDLKFCIVTSISAKTGRASTVVDKGEDTIVIVHNWTSAIAGDDVRGIFTIKPDGQVEFRGQKEELIELVSSCTDL